MVAQQQIGPLIRKRRLIPMESIVTTIVVALAAVAGASLPTYLAGRQRSKDRAQDWLRQDAVAAKAEEAAILLAEQQKKDAASAAQTARLLLAANERVAAQSAAASDETIGRLAQIHKLVNSNLTAQMEQGYASLRDQLILMREVVRLNEVAGRQPDKVALAAIDAIQARIAELGAQLHDRAQATVNADRERRAAK
jgi:hypothetical protein